jgi:hypothetical protein
MHGENKIMEVSTNEVSASMNKYSVIHLGNEEEVQ